MTDRENSPVYAADCHETGCDVSFRERCRPIVLKASSSGFGPKGDICSQAQPSLQMPERAAG